MDYLKDLFIRRPQLNIMKNEIQNAYIKLLECFQNGNKVLICGNGGSSADSAHIMGELMKSFKKKRHIRPELFDNIKKQTKKVYNTEDDPEIIEKERILFDALEQGLPTIDLTAFNALNTAFANDKNADLVFANSILGLGNSEDILIAITTSGNSKNIVNAAIVAKAKNMKVIALTGRDGGRIKNIADINIIVEEQETYKIQEEHIAIYHTLCLQIEEEMFS